MKGFGTAGEGVKCLKVMAYLVIINCEIYICEQFSTFYQLSYVDIGLDSAASRPHRYDRNILLHEKRCPEVYFYMLKLE
jgi:hypothetical protein